MVQSLELSREYFDIRINMMIFGQVQRATENYFFYISIRLCHEMLNCHSGSSWQNIYIVLTADGLCGRAWNCHVSILDKYDEFWSSSASHRKLFFHLDMTLPP